MKIKLHDKVVMFFILLGTSLLPACGGNMKNSGDTNHWTKDFGIWYQWKIKDKNLTPLQKEVITDMSTINNMLSKIESLSSEQDDILAQGQLTLLDKLSVNKLCIKYKNYVLTKAKLLLEKKEAQKKDDDAMLRDIAARDDKNASELFVEFFTILKDIHLVDNYDAEIKNLKGASR